MKVLLLVFVVCMVILFVGGLVHPDRGNNDDK